MVWASWITRPAMVVASSSGKSQSMCRVEIAHGNGAVDVHRAVGLLADRRVLHVVLVCDLADYPSRMSSRVIRPCTSPYSSTTNAS